MGTASGTSSLVRTALAGAEHSGANLLREQGAGGSNPLAPTIHIEAVPPGAAFSFLPSGPGEGLRGSSGAGGSERVRGGLRHG